MPQITAGNSSPGGLGSSDIYPRSEMRPRAGSRFSFTNMVGQHQPYHHFLAYAEILGQTVGMSDDTGACLIPFITSCLKTPPDNMLNSITVFMSVLPESLDLGIQCS